MGAKDRDKKMKGGAQKVDANGRQRYTPEVRVDVCEEHVETLPGGEEAKCWLHTRNAGLKILNLDRNFISDAEVVVKLQPYGLGELVLRNNPCVPVLASGFLTPLSLPPPASESGKERKPGDKDKDKDKDKDLDKGIASDSPPPTLHTGWKLVLQ